MKKLPVVLGLVSWLCSGIVPVTGQTVDPSTPPLSRGARGDLNPLTSSMMAQIESEPAYPSFDSQRLDEQLFFYQQVLAESGPPDILIVGSSRALQGVDPIALEMALAHYGYPGLKIYNFSINGATAQVIDLVVRKILPQNQLPRIILFADGVRAFNSGRVDRTYEAIVASDGYQLLARGINPLANVAQSKATNKPAESREYVNLAANNGDPDRTLITGYQAVNYWLTAVSASVAENYHRQKERATWFPGIEPPAMPTLEEAIGQTSPDQMQPTGFFPVAARYNPSTYYQKYPRVPGRYDGDYANFNLEGEQKAALISLATYTKSRGIPFIVVNLPLNQDYLSDPIRQTSEQQFRQQMLTLSQQKGFTFRDLSNQWPAEHDRFADPSHLNRYGAFAVSLHLAADEIIPWDKAF